MRMYGAVVAAIPWFTPRAKPTFVVFGRSLMFAEKGATAFVLPSVEALSTTTPFPRLADHIVGNRPAGRARAPRPRW